MSRTKNRDYYKTIDGNYSRETKIAGYCTRYKGCLTSKQIKLHKRCTVTCACFMDFERAKVRYGVVDE